MTTFGQKGGEGPNTGKRARKFLCPHPVTGEPVAKRVFKASDYQKPVALWYQHNDVWYLNTVVDAADMPGWAKNYTTGEACDA